MTITGSFRAPEFTRRSSSMPSTRHAHICDHAAVLELGKLVQKNLAGIESAHTEAGRAQQEIQRVAYCRIVVATSIRSLAGPAG